MSQRLAECARMASPASSEADRFGVRILFEVRQLLLGHRLAQAGPGGRRVAGAPPQACWGCHDRAVTDTLARLASDNGLKDQAGLFQSTGPIQRGAGGSGDG